MESVIYPLNIELGKRLRLERERLNLSQESFASINDLTSRTVIEWEKGKTFPNLLQLVRLAEKGLNIKGLFDDIFETKFVDRLIFNDINFVEKKGDYVLTAINRINASFERSPSWKLINIETKYNKNGVDVGLRYYYTYPVPSVFDESKAVRGSYMGDLIKDIKENSDLNKF